MAVVGRSKKRPVAIEAQKYKDFLALLTTSTEVGGKVADEIVASREFFRAGKSQQVRLSDVTWRPYLANHVPFLAVVA